MTPYPVLLYCILWHCKFYLPSSGDGGSVLSWGGCRTLRAIDMAVYKLVHADACEIVHSLTYVGGCNHVLHLDLRSRCKSTGLGHRRFEFMRAQAHTHTHTHTYTHTHARTQRHTHIRAHTPSCLPAHSHARTHTNRHTRTHTNTHTLTLCLQHTIARSRAHTQIHTHAHDTHT